MRPCAAILLACLAAGCDPDPLETRWIIDFGDVDRAGISALAVRILHGPCDPSEGRDAERRRAYLDVFTIDAESFHMPTGGWNAPPLPNGPYCFLVQARHADCVEGGRGSLEVTLPAPMVVVTLVATPPPSDPASPELCGCPTDRCLMDGTCTDDAGGGACACDAVMREYDASMMLNLCANGIDDDCDGATDTADPDCPRPPHETSCADGDDEDGDGRSDCDDDDCEDLVVCGCTGLMCTPGTPGADERGFCDDGVDNDGDGPADCADADCLEAPCVLESGERGHCASCRGNVCVPNTERFCGNGVDEDCDGAVDCRDIWDCRNRLCGDSYAAWLAGGDYGNARCCPQAEGPTEDGCVSFGATAGFSCGACETLCSGSSTCMRIDPHTSPTHADAYTCGGCDTEGCPDVVDPLGMDRRAFACEGTGADSRCYCRHDFACGANAACARGERRHCHPRELNRRPP